MSDHRAVTDHPIREALAERWSPYGFADRDVSAADLRSLFEAARWAASSYNEQPWSYLVAERADAALFARVLGCLVEVNQTWARTVPVLALGVVRRHFERNGNENKAATHDLGLASAQLTVEATARGISVHQMIGLDAERARAEFAVPEGHDVWTALAIGYPGEGAIPEALKQRDARPRTRKPLAEFVFGSAFGKASSIVGG